VLAAWRALVICSRSIATAFDPRLLETAGAQERLTRRWRKPSPVCGRNPVGRLAGRDCGAPEIAALTVGDPRRAYPVGEVERPAINRGV
jgi:hypothetical protein